MASAVGGAYSSFSLKLWLSKAIRKSHGFLMMCWINLTEKREETANKINDDVASQPQAHAHLSRLFKSLAVSTCTPGIICLGGGTSPDRFPLVQPREYWKVCAVNSIANNIAISAIIISLLIFIRSLRSLLQLKTSLIKTMTFISLSLSLVKFHHINDRNLVKVARFISHFLRFSHVGADESRAKIKCRIKSK